MTKQVFEGVKVADFSWVGVGPQAARELAEHGATVVRVECHRYPDTLRLIMPFKDFVAGIDRGAFFAAFNTNKYGMSVDMNRPKGREIAQKLVRWADIVTDGMTPGTMAKWGLDYESCRKTKPDIVYFSTCQQGQYGPYAKFGGYGMFAATMGGFSHVSGWPDMDPPHIFNNYTDFISPWYLVIAVVGALLRRRKTGKGMYIDQAQIEAGITFLGPYVLDYMVNGRVAKRMGNRDRSMAPHGAYPCLGNDRWVVIAVRDDDEWAYLCDLTGHAEWEDDERFATIRARKKNEEILDELIAAWTKEFTPEQIMAMLQSAGIPCGLVERPEDLFNDAQLKHREHFRILEHKVIGKHAYNAPAYRLSKTPNRITKPAPCLGEDNEFVYREILGFSADEIADLLVEGVITTDADLPAVMAP
jgi:benzylsuccinate CoA-transferase BbsF subunit